MTAPLPKTYPEVRWYDDLDSSGVETDSDLESLEQDVYHIIRETLGSNPADPNKGIGADNYLNGTETQLAIMPRLIDAQLAEVDRISNSHTELTKQDDGSYLVYSTVFVGAQVLNFQYVLGPKGLTKAG